MFGVRVCLLSLIVLASCADHGSGGRLMADRSTGGVAYIGNFVPGELDVIESDMYVRILASNGGNVSEMEKLMDHPVIIDGYCASACAFLFTSNDRACFTDDAVFMFHTLRKRGPIIDLLGIRMPQYEYTRSYLARMRPALRDELEEIGHTWKDIDIENTFMRSVYPDRYCDIW